MMELGRRAVAETRMRPDLVAIPSPVFDEDACFEAVLNHSRFRHSSRNRPLKLSSVPFCQGLPGSMNAEPIFESMIHFRIAWLTNSGPLSERMCDGAPRSLTSLFSTSITRADRMPPATSIARHSRVYSSITVRHLICWPLAQASKTKS